jgi:tRNA-(ms[2]io[6]A)-hydroxylase
MELTLRVATGPEWVAAVLARFDDFLLDHAANERKASATALAFVVRYPDRQALIEPMIRLAREELAHFHRVYQIIGARGIRFVADIKDPYMKRLAGHIRGGRDLNLLDRLIVGAVVEARGHERFGLLAGALPAGELQDFYADITRSESRHHELFLELAGRYFDEATIEARLGEFLAFEAAAIRAGPLRAALH